MKPAHSKVIPLIWQDNKLLVLDQRLLPFEKKYLELTTYKQVIEAIKNMTVRGAPLIGITAAYGVALAANQMSENQRSEENRRELILKLKTIGEEIKSARPTAVNLQWAVDLILGEMTRGREDDGAKWRRGDGATGRNSEMVNNEILSSITKRAIWIHEDDAMRCQKIGEHGMLVFSQARQFAASPVRVLTICNTGSLATGGIGTAFGVILTAHQNGLPVKVFVCETRPRQQGARLTTFECIENGIDCTLVSDTACGYLMKKGEIDLVITGADRIASNGDTANKIGTYQLAVLAKEHGIPFYVAAPLSTFDLSIKSGDEIQIEERDGKEVTVINGQPICASGVKARNPAFDITPAKYITGIITENGLETSYLRQFEEKVTL